MVLGNAHRDSSHGVNPHAANKKSLLHRMQRGSLDAIEEPCLVNKNPRWNAQVSASVGRRQGMLFYACFRVR